MTERECGPARPPCHIVCVGNRFAPQRRGRGGWGWALGPGLLLGLIPPGPGRPALQSEGENGRGGPTPRPKKRQTGQLRMGRPKGSTELQGQGALCVTSWGPENGRSCWRASPVMTDGHCPQIKGNFDSHWAAGVKNGENVSLGCALTQVLVLMLWTAEGRGGMSPLEQARVPDPPDGLIHPPPSGGIVRPTNEGRENLPFCCPSVSQPFPGAVPQVTHAPAWDGTWRVGTALAQVLRCFDPADRRRLSSRLL